MSTRFGSLEAKTRRYFEALNSRSVPREMDEIQASQARKSCSVDLKFERVLPLRI